MNKKLGRLLQPGMSMYFGVMACFAVISLLAGQPILFALEGAATAVLFAFYQMRKAHRRRELESFIQSRPTPSAPPTAVRLRSPWRWCDWAMVI